MGAWRNHERYDFIVMTTTFLITIFFAISQGIIVGFLVSMVMLLFRNSKPKIVILGKVRGHSTWRRRDRFIGGLEPIDIGYNMRVIRIDASISFLNCIMVRDYLTYIAHDLLHYGHKVNKKKDKVKGMPTLVIDCSPVNDIDYSAVHILRELGEDLKTLGVDIILSRAKGHVRDILRTNSIYQALGGDLMYLSPDEVCYLYINNLKKKD